VTELLQRVAGYARTEPAQRREPMVSDDRRRPRRMWSAGLAAAVAVAVVLAGMSLLGGDGTTRPVDTSGQLARLPGGTTERLAGSGLLGRTGAASVWTGSELLVWGGLHFDGKDNRWLADGAALDPVANRWRPLPPAPIGPRSVAAAVWTGKEMLVWGGNHLGRDLLTDGAAYDPRTDRWRSMAPQPFGGAARSAAVWTGREMLVVSSWNGLKATAYNPSTDQWRQVADPPGAPLMPYPEAVWTGTELVMVMWPSGAAGTALGSSSPPTGPTVEPPAVASSVPPTPRESPPPLPPPVPSMGGPNSRMYVAAYSPAADRWTRLPAVDMKDGTLPRIVWTGREVLVVQALGGAALDPSKGTWRPLPPLPTSGAEVRSVPAVWTGRYVLLWSGGDDGFAFDPAADAWWRFDAGGLERRNDPVVAWADRLLVAWSGFYDTDRSGSRLASDGIRYLPPE